MNILVWLDKLFGERYVVGDLLCILVISFVASKFITAWLEKKSNNDIEDE